MGKFSETKKRIMAEAGSKKTFNESYFNELSTALINDPSYEAKGVAMKKGELVETTTTPVADLRKSLIGSVAKAAGCDASEQEKLVAEHQFPKLAMYGYVDAAMKEYLSTGKKFTFSREANLQASIESTTQEACIKDVSAPGSKEKKKQRQGEFVKYKVKSTCPDNLKEDI